MLFPRSYWLSSLSVVFVTSVSLASAAEVSLSGQINRAVMYADDGHHSDTMFVDADTDSTRFRIVAKHAMSTDVTIGAQIETEHRSNSSADATIDQTKDATADNAFIERQMEVYFDHKKLGRLWLGQGSVATDGVADQDMSLLWLAGIGTYTADFGASLSFLDANSRTPVATIGEVMDSFDNDNDDRIRYDTPNFAGFSLSVAAATGEFYDVAAYYERKFGDFSIGASIGYADFGDQKTLSTTQFSGSFSVMHSSGVSFTFSAGSQDIEDADYSPQAYYGKVAYQSKLIDLGPTTFGVDYKYAEEVTKKDYEYNSFGIGMTQELEKIGTDLYVGLRRHSLDVPNQDVDHIMVLAAGALVKF